jgi:hypothetical protein
VADAGRDVAVVADAGCDVAVETLVEAAAATSAPRLARCGRSRTAAAMRGRGGVVVVSRQTGWTNVWQRVVAKHCNY